MQGNAPDEEHIDPHGECAAEIKRLREILRRIAEDDYDSGYSVEFFAKSALDDPQFTGED